MINAVKILIVGFLLVGSIVFGLSLWLKKGSGELVLPENTNNYVVNFDELNQKINIRAKGWGLAGNHEEITLCLSTDDEHPMSSFDDCTLFYASEIYYKKEGSDSLLVYVDASAVPKEHKNFLGSIKIVLTELKNSDEIREYATNYEKYGMSKATIYEEK